MEALRTRAGSTIQLAEFESPDPLIQPVSSTRLLARGMAQCWHGAWHSVLPQYGAGPWLLAMLRPLKVLKCVGPALRLLNTRTYRRYSQTALAASLLHWVRTRHYLRKGLSSGQRIQYALDHVAIEERDFNDQYFEAIYESDGLPIWQYEFESNKIYIQLALGNRNIPEGDLRLTLMVNDEALHHIGFSWVPLQNSAGQGTALPFIARNQGRWRNDSEVLELFERAFPQNSASYFTYAALQGVANAMGSPHIRAVRALEQTVFDAANPKHFLNAYDAFWQKLGAVDDGGLGFMIPMPFPMSPIEEVSSKHRKRALQRRAHWQAIETAAKAAVLKLRADVGVGGA